MKNAGCTRTINEAINLVSLLGRDSRIVKHLKWARALAKHVWVVSPVDITAVTMRVYTEAVLNERGVRRHALLDREKIVYPCMRSVKFYNTKIHYRYYLNAVHDVEYFSAVVSVRLTEH